MRGPRARMWKLVGRARGPVALTTALGLVQSATFLPVALLLRQMFDVAIPHHDRREIVLIGIGIAALGALGAAIGIAAQRVGARTARAVIADLRRDLLRRLYAQSATWHDRRDPGVLQLTVVQHTERISDLLRQLTAVALPSLVLAVALLIMTLVLNPILTATLMAAAPAYVIVAAILGGRSRRHYRDWLAAHLRFNTSVRIALRTMGLARVHGAESWELQRRDEVIADVVARSRLYDDAKAHYEGAVSAITGIAAAAPLLVGGLLVSQGQLTLGDLIAFYALGLMALRATSSGVLGIASAAISSEALAEVESLSAEEPPARSGGAVLNPFRGAVAFENVEFAYDAGEPVLRGVNFAVGPGEHVALMGPSGSGKTTIVNLLLGLYECDRGAVRLDGLRIRELDMRALRSQIGVIMQDTVVLPGAVRQNVAYGRDDCNDDLIEVAARAAGLDEVVAVLPGGYSYEVGEEGGLVSGGQRQRIGIARTLLGDPRMLVLDEPTLHLDAASIDRLLATLGRLDCTIITVTHDPQAATYADRVIHVRDGTVWPAAASTAGLAAG